MDAILDFKAHVIVRDVDLKPSERDVENTINEIICKYLGAERVEISELAVEYKESRTSELWKGEENE